MASTPKPSLGRIVIYVDPSMGDLMPAIVTGARDDLVVSLHVFPEFAVSRPVRTVSHSPDKALGTWHWPEKV